MNLLLESDSPARTLEIGRTIGIAAIPNTIITLEGNLGAGKTWLAKGIAYGLDVPDYEYVNSPAYDIAHEYAGRLPIFHLDLYRLDSLSTDDLLMIQDFYAAGGVCLIEWASKLAPYPGFSPTDYIAVTITAPDLDRPDYRTLNLAAIGQRHEDWLHTLEKQLT